MIQMVLLFGLVFVLNLIPAFAPPTWMAMSYIGFRHPDGDLAVLVLVAATAATLGRVVLARGARVMLDRDLLSATTRENILALRDALQQRRAMTAGGFLMYAASPLPSNTLFIAYGLTGMDLRLAAFPFFVGRAASYGFWAYVSAAAGEKLLGEAADRSWWYVAWFVGSQAVFLVALYAFARLDWRALFTGRRVRWVPRAPRRRPKP